MKWAVSLQRKQKEFIMWMAYKSSISNRFQESGYKILSRWYKVPTMLHKMYPAVSLLCWRLDKEEGSLIHILIHIFWNCTMIKPSWDDVLEIMLEILGFEIDHDPALYILHQATQHMQKYKN